MRNGMMSCEPLRDNELLSNRYDFGEMKKIRFTFFTLVLTENIQIKRFRLANALCIDTLVS